MMSTRNLERLQLTLAVLVFMLCMVSAIASLT
jgi:hypothetical protein